MQKDQLEKSVRPARIVHTRFKDVPWSEVAACSGEPADDAPAIWEQEMRGKPLRIITGPLPAVSPHVGCKGPFYADADNDEFCVCPHIAEIGD